jgi:hypothetical protein
VSPPAGPVETPQVRRVLYVAKTHLDVGFTDLAAVVRRRYLEEFFPRAMRVAEELRRGGGTERLRWTTGSWILSEALDAADSAQRRRLESAIDHGDLSWHALPFTLHTEYADPSLLRHGLSLSAELDRRFGRRTRAAKATDVPGHTRALVGLLAEAGVDLLHIGVNPVAAVPRVPLQFRWRDGADAHDRGDAPELSVMYQPGGYGDVQVVAGTDVAVAIDLTGDNVGPRSADEVVAAFAALAERFPGAEVVAATLDDVAAVMASARDRLPVVSAEIGDSWIHGVGSDPQKTAGFRALSRLRRDWLDQGRVAVDDPALRRASTRLLLVAEHTWGMDQKTHWPDTEHWSAPELAEVRGDAATRRFESSWAEQRGLLGEFVDELASDHPELAAQAAAELAAAAGPPARRPLHRSDLVAPRTAVGLGPWQLTVDASGAVVGCVGADGRDWATPDSPLLALHQQTFDAADYERWYSTYNRTVTPADEWWARWDNTKPGLERTIARSAIWPTTLTALGLVDDDEGTALVIEQRVVAADDDPVAAPAAYRTVLRWDEVGGQLRAELCWWARPAARWPGATWWRVTPVVSAPSDWQMVKLGEQVAPRDVVDGGGRWLHVVDRLEHPDGVVVELLDAGLVAPGEPRLLHWDHQAVDLSRGWHLCVLANLWGTNFPMWNEGDGRCRVTVRLPT